MTCKCGKGHDYSGPLPTELIQDRLVRDIMEDIDREMIATMLASNHNVGLNPVMQLTESDDDGIIQSQSTSTEESL